MGAAKSLWHRLKGSSASRDQPRVPRLRPAILAVVHDKGVADTLRGVILPGNWHLEVAESIEAGLERGEQRRFSTVIIDKRLADDRWSDVVSQFSRLPSQPVVLLLSPESQPDIWNKLSQCGGYSLLRFPFILSEAKTAIYSGWLLWNNQEHLRHDPQPTK
jgi:DNA-binding NtrC family response regulator